MRFFLLFPGAAVMLVGAILSLSLGSAIAADAERPVLTGVDVARRAVPPPSLPHALPVVSSAKPPDAVVVDAKAQGSKPDKEEMERRNRLFILMMQILRAPK
jgi:hypothetical protein